MQDVRIVKFWKYFFLTLVILVLFLQGCATIKTENVMIDEMRMTITNDDYGSLTITAVDNNQRCYSWQEGEICVKLKPKLKRDVDGIGIYYFGKIKPLGWLKKIKVQENQKHFDNIDEAVAWLNSLSFIEGNSNMYVWSNTGLVAGWRTYTPDTWFGTWRELQVDVWQIYIGGKEISKYQSKNTPRIRVLDNVDLNPTDKLAREVNKKPIMVGGHKPSSLPGSQDDKIKIEHLNNEQMKEFKKSVSWF